jgi:hypothetical protein
MSQSVSPQVLVKTETIANLERIIEHVDSVPQKFDRRQPRSTRRNLYTAGWTGSIQNPSRIHPGSRGSTGPDLRWDPVRPSSVYSNDDDDNRQFGQARLKRAAVAFAQAVTEQHLAKSPFHSPLVAYVAMRSVAGTGSWMPFGSFSSHPSALIYCGQLWVFRFVCGKIDLQTSMPSGSKGRDPDIDDGLYQALDSYMEEFFSNEKSKPYGIILL